MAYTRVNFVDNVTPLDQAHLNVVDAGVAANDAALATKADTSAMTAADALKVDKDSVVIAATRIVANKLAGADAQPAFRILGDGTLGWGPGGGTALDTSLARSSSNTLTTPGTLKASGVFARFGLADQVFIGTLSGNGGIALGSAQDTSLYRAAANKLKTDGVFVTGAGAIYFGGAEDTNLYRFASAILGTDNEFRSPAHNTKADGDKYYFGPSYDTYLYRQAASVLSTNSQFYSANYIAAFQGTANEATLGQARLILGGDTSLYRAAASYLKTDGNLQALGDFFARVGDAQQVLIGFAGPSSQAGLKLGSAGDTNLYRQAANALKTDGQLQVGLDLIVGISGGTPTINFWPLDTNLYRQGASVLKTDSNLQAGGYVISGASTANQITLYTDGKLYFGNALDTNLYRVAAGVLSTPGKFKPASLVIQVKAGTPADGDIASGSETGAMVWDNSAQKLWIRDTAGWRYVVFT